MGALADGIVAFAQPLLDQTDGSVEQMNKAFAVAQLCFNLAILPEDSRDKMLGEMQQSVAMDNEEFKEFQRSIVVPMIRRHEEMFPLMHRRISASPLRSSPSPVVPPRLAAPAEKGVVPAPYAPCPCNSGKKYRFCCGVKGR